ncbi:hypothetical protein Noda2021_02280 [Candidatus Dependentiae bacterium Noda2021]|nr:hypothetical protein Noda2021_02280 [Candidatus Dependentiae bacterium Noda2021]
MKKRLLLCLTLHTALINSVAEPVDFKSEEYKKREFVNQLPAEIKDFCTKNLSCNECYELVKMVYCAQNRPLAWELTKAEKNGDYTVQSVEEFCNKSPWNIKDYPVRKGDTGTYYTYRYIYEIVSDIAYSKRSWERNSDMADLLGKQFEEMSQKRVKDNAYFKQLVALLPDEIKKLCEVQIHDAISAKLLSAFSDPFLYNSAYVSHCIEEMAKNQHWAPETTVKYMEQSKRAFTLRKTTTIREFLQFGGALKPVAEICKELNIPLGAGVDKLAYFIHYMIDGDVRNAHHVLKKEYEQHIQKK